MKFRISLFLLAACDGEKDGDILVTGDTGADADTDTDSDSDTDTDTDTDSDTDTGAVDPLAIAGSYTDEWGTTHLISDTEWSQQYYGYDPSVFQIASYDNAEYFIVAQNDPLDPFNPSLWSRFDWSETGGALYYCQSTFDAATEQDALATPRADDSDPSAGGCGGFPWTNLTP
jgi:hypothetical protein